MEGEKSKKRGKRQRIRERQGDREIERLTGKKTKREEEMRQRETDTERHRQASVTDW